MDHVVGAASATSAAAAAVRPSSAAGTSAAASSLASNLHNLSTNAAVSAAAAIAAAKKRASLLHDHFTAPEGTYRCVGSLISPAYIVDDGKAATSTIPPAAMTGIGAVNTPLPGNTSPSATTKATPAASAAPTILALSQASAAAYLQYSTSVPQLSCVSIKYPLSKGKEKEQARARAAALTSSGGLGAMDEEEDETLGLAYRDMDASATTSGTLMNAAGLSGIGKMSAGLRKGIGLGGAPTNVDDSGAASGVPAHLRSNAGWTRPLVEATLAGQGIDFPAKQLEPPLNSIASYRESLAVIQAAAPLGLIGNSGQAGGGGMDGSSNGDGDAVSSGLPPRTPTSATGTSTPFHGLQLPPLSSLLSNGSISLGRPKNNLRGANSSFVTRFNTHMEFTKLLASRNGSGDNETFSFVNHGNNLTWLLDSAGLRVKEPLCKIGFAAPVTAHDVNSSTRTASSLDVIIGFTTGDLVWLDPISAKYTRINKGGVMTSSPVLLLRWIPGTDGAFLAAHADGTVIVYEVGRDDNSGMRETGWVPKTADLRYIRDISHLSSDPLASPLVGSRHSAGPSEEALEVLAGGREASLSDAGESSSIFSAVLTNGGGGGSVGSNSSGGFLKRPRLPTRTLTSSTVASAGGSDSGTTAHGNTNGNNGANGSHAPPGLTSLSSQDLAASVGSERVGIADVWDPQRSMLVTRPGARSGTPHGPNLIETAAQAIPSKAREPNWARSNPVSHWRVCRDRISGMAFSPDASLLAITAEDGSLRIVDVEGEKLLDSFESYFGGFTCLCWSPDGRFLATGGQDDLITIFAPREGRVLARCQGHSSFVTSIAFDPWRWKPSDRTYRFGSVGEDGKLVLWDFSSATLRRPKQHAHAGHGHSIVGGANASVSGFAALQRTSIVGSTFSLMDRLATGRRGSLPPIQDRASSEHGEGIVHAAPKRSDTALLLPVTTHQLDGSGVGMLSQVRFRPEAIVVLHRDAGIDTFLRPGVSVAALGGPVPPSQSASSTQGTASGTSASLIGGTGQRPGSSRSRGLSFGLRKNTAAE